MARAGVDGSNIMLSPIVRVTFAVGGRADGRQGDDSYLGLAKGIK